MVTDSLDGRLLNLLQTDFPLAARPFLELGQRLGMAEQEALRRTERMKAEGLIRRIGVVIDWRRLGFRSILVALKVPEERLDEAAGVVSQHPGVTHNYSRQHQFNLWFTLTVPPEHDPEAEASLLATRAGADAALNLPSVRTFKLTANFNMIDGGSPILEAPRNGHTAAAAGPFAPAPEDTAVLRALNGDLPLRPVFFEAGAAHAGLRLEDFLARAAALKGAAVVRRYGAVVHHVRAGFKANALSCWKAPGTDIEAIGAKVASFPAVSHCYERRVGNGWHYNLFAMLHAQTLEACRNAAADIAGATGLTDYLMLFTRREYKKERLGYLS